MKIAHISDIHFFQFCRNPLQIFSKQVLGNFNYFFRRRGIHNQDLPYQLIATLHRLEITHLIITGDYTCISSRIEFLKMQQYVQLLTKEGFKVYTLPGNHDSYTKSSDRNKSFYNYLSPFVDFKGQTPFNLMDDRVAAYQLLDKWWLVCVDCAHAMPYLKSTGLFAPKTEENLQAILASLPTEASIILASHFPYDYDNPKAYLERGDFLKAIVENHPKIRIFMHGHRHKHRIEKNPKGFFTLDSGSISLKSNSSFNLLELDKESCVITEFSNQNSTWKSGHVERCLV